MIDSEDKLERFLILTNPLFWLIFIPAYWAIRLWEASIITSWWQYLFGMNAFTDEQLSNVIRLCEVHHKNNNLNQYKRWHWRLCSAKAKRILESRNDK